jgi:hypothetical protein
VSRWTLRGTGLLRGRMRTISRLWLRACEPVVSTLTYLGHIWLLHRADERAATGNTGGAGDVQGNRHVLPFLKTTVEFNAKRLDEWVQKVAKLLGPPAQLPPLPTTLTAEKLGQDDTTVAAQDGNVVEAIVQAIRQEPSPLTGEKYLQSRLRIVQLAAAAAQSPEATLEELERVIPSADPSRVLRYLRLISRVSGNLTMLARIASLLPSFRNVSFIKVEAPTPTRLGAGQAPSLAKAWKRLDLADSHGALPSSLSGKAAMFRRDCSRAFPAHCEVQLLLRYEAEPFLAPSLAYLGCSKRACFLCFHFLSLSHLRLKVRGHHGVCYPLWGVGPSHSEHLRERLQQLCEILKGSIAHYSTVPRGNRETPALVVPQSTVVSDIKTADMVELRRQFANRKLLETESERARQGRQIL